MSNYLYLENHSKNEGVVSVPDTVQKGLNQTNIKQFLLLLLVVFLKMSFPDFLEMTVKVYSQQVQHA